MNFQGLARRLYLSMLYLSMLYFSHVGLPYLRARPGLTDPESCVVNEEALIDAGAIALPL